MILWQNVGIISHNYRKSKTYLHVKKHFNIAWYVNFAIEQ